MKAARIHDHFATLYKAYDKDPPDKAILKEFARWLRRYSDAALTRAFERGITEGGWTRDKTALAFVLDKLHGSPDDAAALAWPTVRAIITSPKADLRRVFDDPAAERAARDLGSWYSIGSMSARDVNFLRGQFITLYKAYAADGKEPNEEREGVDLISTGTMNGRRTNGDRPVLLAKPEDQKRLPPPAEDVPPEEPEPPAEDGGPDLSQWGKREGFATPEQLTEAFKEGLGLGLEVKECNFCKGSGAMSGDSSSEIPCDFCGGTGKVEVKHLKEFEPEPDPAPIDRSAEPWE